MQLQSDLSLSHSKRLRDLLEELLKRRNEINPSRYTRSDVWICRDDFCCMAREEGPCLDCVTVPGYLGDDESLAYFDNQIKGN